MPILESLIPAVAGGAMGIASDAITQGRTKSLMREQVRNQKKLMDYNAKTQLQMWKDTNYGPQVEQMNAAGINPGLLYGMSGGGGTTTGGGAPGASGGQATNTTMQGLGMGIQLGLMNAQKENIEADTKLKEANAAKTSGVDTENVKANTENTILQSIITKYTGQEAKDVYEKIKSPNREIETKTYQDEMEAKQGIAGTIYELWSEGKLKDKSISEIEQIALQNSKTREETRNIYKTGEILEQNLKGAKLDNIIKELETEMQTRTGIDSKGPTWLKMLGRLFVELTK